MTVQETAAKLLEEYTRIAPMPSEQRRRSSTASSNGSNHANNASTSKSKRKSTSLPQETVEYLKNWMMSPEHIAHPYPTEQEKAFIMKETGIELKQLTNWFVNNRKRYWKPRVEARLQQQQQATTGSSSSSKVQSPAARVDDEDKNPFLVTPTRRSELIHVVSTPNVTATLQKVQDLVVVDQHAQEEEETGACPVVTESSGSSSESESVGLNYDALDDGSSAQSKEEEHATTTTRTVSAMPLLEAATTIPFPHDESATTDDAPPQDVETFSRTNTEPADSGMESDSLGEPEARARRSTNKRRHARTTTRRRTTITGQQEEEDDEARSMDAILAPRPKYRRTSLHVWKEACETAPNGYYCRTLPTLDEAARLFGFA